MTKVRLRNPIYDAVEITDVDNLPVPITPIGENGDLTTRGDPIEVGDWCVNRDPTVPEYLVYPKEFVEVVPEDEIYPRDGSDVYPPPEEFVPGPTLPPDESGSIPPPPTEETPDA